LQSPNTLSDRDRQRNFFWGVINGALFNMSDVFLDTDMVMSWFLSQLGASNFLIGLVGPIRNGCWFLPQIFVSGYLQRLPHKMPFYRSMVVWRLIVLFAQVVGLLAIPTGNPWMLPVFFGTMIVYSLGAGLAGIPFMDMVGKVVPPTRRGTFFGQRMFFGGLLALGASSLVGFLLGEPRGLHFPANFAVLFVLAAVLVALSSIAWFLVKEPPGEVDPAHARWAQQVRRGVSLLRDNPHYRTFVLTRLSLMIAQVAAPFYIVYAKTVLGISPQMVGVYLTVRTAASISFNLIWGRISDRHGNRLLIRLSNIVGFSMPLVALLIGFWGRISPVSWGLQSGLFALVFVASGAFGAGSAIGNMSYLLDIAPSQQRSLYLGFTNTLLGIGIFTASLGGLIVDWAGFNTLLVISAGFYLVAILLAFFMIEPRTEMAA
jgi:MFS family permease